MRTLVAAIVFIPGVTSMCEAGETTRRLFLDDHHIQEEESPCRMFQCSN